MIDDFGRNIDYLRISVTDRCNLRCQYCMPAEGVEFIPHDEILSYDEILKLCKVFAELGVQKIKITGGEPLVRKDICSLIAELRQLNGIKSVTVTTNGVLLKQYAKELSDAGVDGINVSLDTLNRENFKRITRADHLDHVLDGMREAMSYQIPIKINCVPLFTSDEEIVQLVQLAKENIHVRFIEVMPIGLGKHKKSYQEDEIKQMIEKAYGELKEVKEQVGNGPCTYYALEGFTGYIGFISAMSHKFCESCNRVRLTSTGFLKTCLQYELGVDLKSLVRTGASSEELKNTILKAIGRKPQAHAFEQETVGNQEMNIMAQIGG